MNAHRPQLLLAAFAAGLAASPYVGAWIWAAALVAALATIVAGTHRDLLLTTACVFIAGIALGDARVAAYDAIPVELRDARQLQVEAFVAERFRAVEHGVRGRVALVGAPVEGARVEVRLRDNRSFDEISIGDGVALRGRLRPRDGAGDSFDRWLRAEGVDAVFDATAVWPTGRQRGGPVGALDAVRRRAERALAAGLPDQPAALMRGMVLGGDEQFAPDLRDDFRAAGLSHIVAVSGSNVLLLVILVGALCGAAGVGYRPRFAVALASVCVYVPLCGAGASVVRAGVMGVVALIATRVARPLARWHALSLAAIALLLLNPRAAEDIGAQLSFVAVVGLVLFAGPLQRRLGGLPRWLAEATAATVAATIATAPIAAFHFGRLSLVSLLANVLAAPAIGPVVWLGSVAAALGQIAIAPAALLNSVSGFLLAYLIELAGVCARLPGAQADVRLGPVGLVVAVALIAVAAWFTHRGAPRWLSSRLRGDLRPVRGLAWCAAAAVATALLVATARPATPVARPAIVFLDVGQGDSVLLLGRDGCDALIDGGPRGAPLPAALKRFGVERLELVLATHPASDHHGGLLDLMRSGRVGVDRYLAGGLPTRDASYAELERRMRSQGAAVAEAAAGASWRCGDLAIDVIGPPPARRGERPPDDPNTRAAVVRARVGQTTLLTSGDAESPQLLPLSLAPAEVLKVPHHGSEDEGLERVIALVRPQLAVIQVGAGNSYGHPRAATLRALAAVPQVKRTDRDGTVVVRASVEAIQ